MINTLKEKLPKFEATPRGYMQYAGIYFLGVIALSLVAVVIKFIIGLLAIGVLVCLMASATLAVSGALQNRKETK